MRFIKGASSTGTAPLFSTLIYPGSSVLDPCVLATAAIVPVAGFLFRARRQGWRGVAFERRFMAVFLAGMPFVYLTRASVAGTPSSLWLEGLGVPLFCAAAILGLIKSPWYLVAGVVSHGLAWDAWHFGTCPYIPDWYSATCFLVDLALAGYLVSRIPIYNTALTNSGR